MKIQRVTGHPEILIYYRKTSKDFDILTANVTYLTNMRELWEFDSILHVAQIQ